jgi:hypothetical protein
MWSQPVAVLHSGRSWGSSSDYLRIDQSGRTVIHCHSRARNIENQSTEAGVLGHDSLSAGPYTEFLHPQHVLGGKINIHQPQFGVPWAIMKLHWTNLTKPVVWCAHITFATS